MFVAIMATWGAILAARRLRIVDMPGARKIHTRAIPRVGGVAIVLAMLAATLPLLWMPATVGERFRQVQTPVVTLLAGGVFMFFIGLIDDIRGLRARVKLLGQLLAATAVCLSGTRIDHLGIGNWTDVDLGWWSWPLTVFWIVGITNALNLIDGLDGLAAGISAITAAALAFFAICMNQPVTAVIMLALLGSLVGFLFLNFNPARIFMGDSGSLFIGFVLAAVSVRCATREWSTTRARHGRR